MARFVVDRGVVLQLVSDGVDVAPEHELLAPTLPWNKLTNPQKKAHIAARKRKARRRG